MYKIAYYKLENYHQCPLRVVLMEQFGYSGKLFLPQFLGLVNHEYFEILIGKWAGYEETFDRDATIERILREREPAFTIDEAMKALERQPYEVWTENLMNILNTEEKPNGFLREYKREMNIGSGVLLTGVCDILLERENGREVVDLKFTRRKEHYNRNQLLIYSYLFETDTFSYLFFEANGSVEKKTMRIEGNEAKRNRLLGELKYLGIRIGKRDFAGFRPKHGATCHPNRCAMWDYCPAVINWEQEGVNEYAEYHYGEILEGVSAEDELFFDDRPE